MLRLFVSQLVATLPAPNRLAVVGAIMAFMLGQISAMDPARGAESRLEVSSAQFAGHTWKGMTYRAEVQPQFESNSQSNTLGITTSGKKGLAGWWETNLPVTGGKHYMLRVRRTVSELSTPWRSVAVRIDWRDDQGKRVPSDRPFVAGVLEGWHDVVQPDYPGESPLAQTNSDPTASSQTAFIEGTHLAPIGATTARIELHLRWADNAHVSFDAFTFQETEPPAQRVVQLASIHFRPPGKSIEGNREAFVPLIESAVKAGADLVVLPETLTYYGTGLTPIESAETVPGPTSDFFGKLADRLDCHIVATCFERDKHLVFNVAMLLGPDGKLIGKYRKVCLPRSEFEAGVTPGTEYPVFDTALGKIGLMVCYDGFFPQVAQRLTDNGAEVIAWPVWGCNPLLAQARAAENQVVLVSSTYEPPERNWMLTAIYDHNGKILDSAKTWGSFVMAEVDISQTPYWRSLGDHRAERFRHQPAR